MTKIDIKNILGAGVVLVAISIGYYFGIFLPKEKASLTLSANQSRCLQLEKDAVNDWKKVGENDTISGSNHYNIKLNKCIVEISSVGRDSITVLISDATEDSKLASCITTYTSAKEPPYCYAYTGDKKITKEEFSELEKMYLSE